MLRFPGTYGFEPGFSVARRCLLNLTKNTLKYLKSTGREHSEKCKNAWRLLVGTRMQPGGGGAMQIVISTLSPLLLLTIIHDPQD